MHNSKAQQNQFKPEGNYSCYSIGHLAEILQSVYGINEHDKRVWQLAHCGDQSVHEILQHWILSNLTQLDAEMASDLVRFLCRRFEAVLEAEEVKSWTK